MRDLIIEKPYGYCKEIVTDIDLPALRVYKNTPETIHVQIRYSGPITDNRKGKSRNMISGIDLNHEEAASLVNKLNDFLSNNK